MFVKNSLTNIYICFFEGDSKKRDCFCKHSLFIPPLLLLCSLISSSFRFSVCKLISMCFSWSLAYFRIDGWLLVVIMRNYWWYFDFFFGRWFSDFLTPNWAVNPLRRSLLWAVFGPHVDKIIVVHTISKKCFNFKIMISPRVIARKKENKCGRGG